MSRVSILVLLLVRALPWGGSTDPHSHQHPHARCRGLCLRGGAREEQEYLSDDDLVQLTRPLRRYRVEHPPDYLVYNRTADKWQQGVFPTYAISGMSSCAKVNMALKRFGRPGDTREDVISRCGCEPPYCATCPLRGKIHLTTRTMLLYKDLTGRRINVTTAMRSGINETAFPGLSLLAYHCDQARGHQAQLDYLLCRYVEDGHQDFIAKLIQLGANVHQRDANEMTLLHEAACQGHTEVVELLLDLNLDCYAVDEYKRTPLHWAAFFGHLAVIIAMFKHPNGIKPSEHVKMIYKEDDERDSAFSLAIIAGRPACYSFFSRVKDKGFDEAERLAQDDLEYLKTCPREMEQLMKLHEAIQQENLKEELEDQKEEEERSDRGIPNLNFNKTQRCVVGVGNHTIVNELPWGPGTDNPTPWVCWFCESEFGRCAEAIEHELQCCHDYGFMYDPERGWLKNESDQIVKLGIKGLDSRILANDRETMDIEDMAEGIYNNFILKEKSKRSEQTLPPHWSKALRNFHSRAQTEPQKLAEEMKKMFLCSSGLLRPFDFNQTEYPVGIATKTRYEQLPPYLRDKEKYAQFMVGEDVKPPQLESHAEEGMRLLSDLSPKEKAALGIEQSGATSQTSSLLRRKKINAMNKDDLIDALDRYGFGDYSVKNTIALKQLLIDVETELGLILPPPDWNQKKRRLMQIDQRFLRKKMAMAVETVEETPAAVDKNVKKNEEGEDQDMLVSEPLPSQADVQEDSRPPSQISARSSSAGAGESGEEQEEGSLDGGED